MVSEKEYIMNRQDMEYGYYFIGRGRHKGNIAYFDDDMTDKSGYFYLGAFRDSFVVIPFSFIERDANALEIAEHVAAGKGIAQY
jgi:hypothetical protein